MKVLDRYVVLNVLHDEVVAAAADRRVATFACHRRVVVQPLDQTISVEREGLRTVNRVRTQGRRYSEVVHGVPLMPNRKPPKLLAAGRAIKRHRNPRS